MSKRPLRPIYAHDGFALRRAKTLSSGAELLHCIERKTKTQCGAVGRREADGSISISKPHTGHLPDESKVQAKLARAEIKEIARTSNLPPREIFHITEEMFGIPIDNPSTLRRMINRSRNPPETTEVVESEDKTKLWAQFMENFRRSVMEKEEDRRWPNFGN